jgi:hypothetical protein
VETGILSNNHRFLAGLLRVIGLLDLFAWLAVVAPRSWIDECHQMLGLGHFPVEPIAGYLARSTSFWYASYGMLLWFVSSDVEKNSQLISCLAWIMVVQGFVIIEIDIAEGMPGWWTAVEGPCCIGLGASLLFAQGTQKSANES